MNWSVRLLAASCRGRVLAGLAVVAALLARLPASGGACAARGCALAAAAALLLALVEPGAPQRAARAAVDGRRAGRRPQRQPEARRPRQDDRRGGRRTDQAPRRLPQHRGPPHRRRRPGRRPRSRTAPSCSARCRPPSADVPPDRIGAVDHADRRPGRTTSPPTGAALPPDAPLHVLLSGHDGETDRRIVIDSAPRFGIVNEQQMIKYPRRRRRRQRHRRPVTCRVNLDGKPLAVETVTPGVPSQFNVNIAPRRAQRPRIRGGAACRRADADQQPRRRRRSRASARTCACCWSRASRTPASAPGATC